MFETGDKVDVYWNIRKKVFSVRKQGKVVAHVLNINLADVEFVVSQAGRKRVVETGVKNVHAVIRGTVAANSRISAGHDRVTYNPHRHKHFVYFDSGYAARYSRKAVLFVRENKPIVLATYV